MDRKAQTVRKYTCCARLEFGLLGISTPSSLVGNRCYLSQLLSSEGAWVVIATMIPYFDQQNVTLCSIDTNEVVHFGSEELESYNYDLYNVDNQ